MCKIADETGSWVLFSFRQKGDPPSPQSLHGLYAENAAVTLRPQTIVMPDRQFMEPPLAF